MPRLAQQREGDYIKINRHSLSFSFWPMKETKRRYGLSSRIFATNPWPIIERSIETNCPKTAKPAAKAFLEQSKDFYNSALTAGVSAAKPVQLYYSFLNLVKAFILTRGQQSSLDKAYHGLKERLGADGHELKDAYLEAIPTGTDSRGNCNLNMFDEFLRSIGGSALRGRTRFGLSMLIPQIVPGHRLWVDASNAKERFLTPSNIAFMENKTAKEVWLRMYFRSEGLTRLHLTHKTVFKQSGLSNAWQQVHQVDQHLLCFEQKHTIFYSGRAADKIVDLIDTVKPLLWRTAINTDPYRKYYIYLAPDSERDFVLPQLLSIYAVLYYLGSITRYRPHQFDKILQGEHGPFIEAFLNDQPTQFLFLMASEFARREVTKAALV